MLRPPCGKPMTSERESARLTTFTAQGKRSDSAKTSCFGLSRRIIVIRRGSCRSTSTSFHQHWCFAGTTIQLLLRLDTSFSLVVVFVGDFYQLLAFILGAAG